MRFSSLADSLPGTKNPLYRLYEDLAGQGKPIVDLVRGNVNDCGIVFPQDELREILSAAVEPARVYRPDPFGQLPAREAVSAYYDALIPPRQILLTPGSSISYWYCFKLLAEPGDEILTPRPSYPLFDYIAKIGGVKLTTYRLLESRQWDIDLDHLEAQITTRTRAIALISPHNPTGMTASRAALDGLAEIAGRHRLPIVSDEVFSEFLFGIDALPRPAQTSAPLVFTLNGFSKMFALPGLKLGWIAVSGDPPEVERALAALEIVSDTFLPVNEIVQFAAPGIFARGREFLRGYKAWAARCRSAALDALAGCKVAPPQGGFYLTAALEHDEEAAAERLLRDYGVLAHPGYFYDIPPDHLVATFVQDPLRIPEIFGNLRKVLQG